ncbi:MAG TPA: MFS transporter [Actinoplanes sp.]|nr:MFS transporter [Actinoplanes sp.]
MLVLSRLVCALAHGVFWSVIGPITARLAPPGQVGRATSLVFIGNSLAIVFGVPLGTALGQWLGWRLSIGLMAVAGAICLVALTPLLPPMQPLPRDREASLGRQMRDAVLILRNSRVTGLCVITVVLVWGGAFNALPVFLGSAPMRVAPTSRDAASAVYVVAFQIGIGSGAFIGERFVGAGNLGTLPLLGAGLVFAGGLLVVMWRGVFPNRITAEEHQRAEAAAAAR